MPAMVFPATCPACGKDAKFIEFKAEPCMPGEEAKREYAFTCLACRTRRGEVTDAAGRLHRWVDGRHVEA